MSYNFGKAIQMLVSIIYMPNDYQLLVWYFTVYAIMESLLSYARFFRFPFGATAMMAVKQQNIGRMKSPERHADIVGDDFILPHHATRSPLSMPSHHGEASSSEESSTCSFWSSPTQTVRSETDSFCLPTWSANPQSPGADRKTSPLTVSAQRTSSSVLNHPRRAPLLILGFLLVGVAAVFTSQTRLNVVAGQVSVLEHHREELGGKLIKYEKDIRLLEREISAMDIMIQKQHSMYVHTHHVETGHQRAQTEMSELQQRLHAESTQVQNLKQQVQALSRDDIIEKYGSGFHRVEIELVFPDHHRGPTKFIIELAPVDIMPHSVHTFLEMVSTGLLDGCSFILYALHVLKAAPLPYDGTSAAEKAKAFLEKGLESVAFKEYSDDFPHKKYTVGFAADGSPSFYINTEDNREIHVGDPCFGKVVSGFDTVQRLQANPTRNGIWFERRIGIKSARVISD